MWSKLLVVGVGIGIAAIHTGGSLQGRLSGGGMSAQALLTAPEEESRPPSRTVAAVVTSLVQDIRERFGAMPHIQHLRAIQENGDADEDAAAIAASQDTKSFLPYLFYFASSLSDINRMVLPYSNPQGDA
jgi:uncharacterized protein YgfB (UPF0149 family)